MRAMSFGAIAGDYDRFRPGPPPEALEWLLPGQRRAAVDIGAGTGALTRLLVGDVAHVVAVEPDRRMGAVLAARVRDASVVAARAEALPLRDRCVDAVVGSSMWHWVDEERAVFEAARVLRPGGVLGLLWNGPDRSQPWLADLLARLRPGDHGPSPSAGDDAIDRHRQVHLPPDAPFTGVETQTVDWSLSVTPEELVGLAGTYSRFIILPEVEKMRLRRDLAAVVRQHAALAGRREIDLPMRCLCWRAVRAG